MNTSAMLTLARRDLAVVRRSRSVMLPLFILPAIFFILMPAGLVIGVTAVGMDLRDFTDMLAVMPPGVTAELAGHSVNVQIVIWTLEYAFVSFFLMVPVMTSAVIAADSFAGEKERKTLEALLYTPTTDAELYLGKALAPWIASVAVAIGGFIAYAVVSNVFAAGLVGRPVVLTPRWLLVVGWLTPGVSALAVAALVQVSVRVRGFQEAYQLGGLVVLPIILLLIAQVSGAVYLDVVVVFAVGVVVWALACVGLIAGYRSFRRVRLLAQT